MKQSPAIVWFRNDLRLSDNPALSAAVQTGAPVVCIYILEDDHSVRRAMGGASKWWLDKSLRALGADIAQRGGALVLRRGDPLEVLTTMTSTLSPSGVFWNRRYGEAERNADAAVKSALRDCGCEVRSFNGNLLTEPWEITTGSGGHYKVFTPYWRAVREVYTPPSPLAPPNQLAGGDLPSDALDDWNLHPSRPDWSSGLAQVWSPGEAGAAARLEAFIDGGLATYGEGRNRPDINTGTSGLSPHLAFGEISPAAIWRRVHRVMKASGSNASQDDAWTFLSEIGWREFSYVLLYHHPKLASESYNKDFRHMPWRAASGDLARWQEGRTGYPIVDAGMRQLWQTGWMHNRVRMIVSSFLTKHLLIRWQDGEAWFWDTLVDADPASNAASWQWVAGSGADASPYFRVFNPITQGQKFDPDGNYVRTFVPELAGMPAKHIHAPWEAPRSVSLSAGLQPGSIYLAPVVDHKPARQRALDAYEEMKQKRDAA